MVLSTKHVGDYQYGMKIRFNKVNSLVFYLYYNLMNVHGLY